MADSGEEEENYWPGYVDALTTMTMVLTFVMMVLGVAVFILSQNVSKVLLETIVKKVDKNIEVTPTTSVETLMDAIVEAVNKAQQKGGADASKSELQTKNELTSDTSVASLTAEEKVVDMTAPEEEKKEDAPVQAVVSQSALTLGYTGRSVKIDEAAALAINEFATNSPEAKAGARFEVRAYANVAAGGISEQRRTAYYRAMMVRKELLAAGIDPEKVKVQVEDATKDEDTQQVHVFAKP